MTTTTPEAIADRTLSITRLIEGPVDVVWRAFTDERHLDQWWGPNGFINTTSRFAFAPGEEWEFMMKGPDGTEYPNHIEWREIVPNERITFVHGETKGDPNGFESIITFAAVEGGTEITLANIMPTVEAKQYAIEHIGAVEGGQQTLGKLAEYVKKLREI